MTSESLQPATGLDASKHDAVAVEGSNEIVLFPQGLPGFESCRSFVLFSAEAGPLQWLSSVEGAAASFLTIDPKLVMPTFRYTLSRTDLARLGSTDGSGLLWLAIVLIEPDGTLTANLRAPIVINPTSMVGQQVLPHDCLYPLRHVIVPASAG